MPDDWKIFRDADRFIIGRRGVQTCTSLTIGVAEAYSGAEARRLLHWAKGLTPVLEAKHTQSFTTDGRFETAFADVADPL